MRDALHMAILRNDLDEVNKRLSGIPLNHFYDTEWETILGDAIQCRQIDIVRMLIDRGADVNHRTKHGRTALHVAVKCRFRQAVALLLIHGADPSLRFEGQNPMKLALENEDFETADVMLANGVSLDLVKRAFMFPSDAEIKWFQSKSKP